MENNKVRNELFKEVSDAVVDMDKYKVEKIAHEIINEGLDACDALLYGLAFGMKTAAELYEKYEYFVPELLMCADAFYAGHNILKQHIKDNYILNENVGSVVIGTVQGDMHDIGKNIIKLVFEAYGFTVYDLGKDVPLEKFVNEQERTKSTFVAMSAMMTTSMMGMQKVSTMLKIKNPNVKIILGGAPLNKNTAKKLGADLYAESAINLIQNAINTFRN